jgi:hypothetical protein
LYCGLRGLQSIHVADVNRKVKPDNPDKEYAMLKQGFNTIAGFDDGSDTPNNISRQ